MPRNWTSGWPFYDLSHCKGIAKIKSRSISFQRKSNRYFAVRYSTKFLLYYGTTLWYEERGAIKNLLKIVPSYNANIMSSFYILKIAQRKQISSIASLFFSILDRIELLLFANLLNCRWFHMPQNLQIPENLQHCIICRWRNSLDV